MSGIRRRDTEAAELDVEFSGTFSAAELTYVETPRARLRTEPEQAERVDDHARANLPPDPERGHTYEDVSLDWRLGARINEDPAGGRSHGD